ncbi:MAG: hypothetical protein COS42_02545 [Flavobacteriales bacterium CG03_land_8_20_14_0_80_35_15]|nr:MAG: hypothetical protein AUJ53_09325 [Flavobacteriaceae bacterium CG1_02_35_72]PIV18084.1 MAG: hypothetical protein COS42_02545 [Flavobacteriales bacterium CG03_land_8_20_14_0_80_35_15]PIX06395.1 MAG: hypothetical protein COZ76_09100 [Flavobacteriales bacterium CG_4_8_14_3_um_filter_35_10]PJA05378.1 MAG: hypothetical protein COX71_06850 [Flavobacteriales bacterium CG_4_10_14_0_2_um_filter_35_18]
MISATHLHALIIHFPIALLIVGYFSELFGLINKKLFFKEVSFYLLFIGVIGAIAAYISGNLAGDGIESGSLKVPVELHEQAGLITLLLAIATVLFKSFVMYLKKDSTFTKWITILLFTFLIGSVMFTGYLGGELVYSHGAGVELAPSILKNHN